MYQALYRKYRPKTFSDVVGQSHITEILKNQIEKDRISHAYMFTGTRGTGKTSCAKILARAVNCENPQNGDPCNECSACLSILNDSTMDVNEIDAASNNKVDDIRELLDVTRYTPTSLKKRVYIIDEVHMLTTQAFNALLKTLEEPPSHVLFILATTEIHKVLPTILSRCQRFDFKRINMDDISNRLIDISSIEGFELEKSASNIISKLADGGLRDALSILDRCIVSDESLINADMVCSRVGAIDYTKLIVLMENITSKETLQAISQINELYLDGIELKTVIEQLMSLCRDMLLYKITKDESFSIVYNISIEKFSEMCENIDDTRLTNFVDEISKTLISLQKSQNKKIDVELCIIKLCKDISTKHMSIDERIYALEEKITNFKPEINNSAINDATICIKKEQPKNTNKTEKIAKMDIKTSEEGIFDVEQYRHLLRNLKSIYRNRELIFLNENSKALFFNDKIRILVNDEITFNMINVAEKRLKVGEKATELFSKNLFIEVCYENQQIDDTKKAIDDVLDIALKNNITIKNMED